MGTDDSDFIDSDTEAYLYSQVHHSYQPPSNCDVNNRLEEQNNNRRDEQDAMTFNDSRETVSSDVSNAITAVLPADRTVVATKRSSLPGHTGFSITIANDRKPFTSFTDTSSDRNKLAEKRGIVNDTTTRVQDSNSLAFGVHTVTTQNVLSKPTVKVLTDMELKAERQNRRQSLLDRLSFPSKCVGKKRKLTVQSESKLSDDSSDSSEDAMRNWKQSGNHEVVINIDSSADRSGQVEAEQGENDLSLWEINHEDRLSSPRSKDKKTFLVCYNCRERGHLSKSCKKPKRVMNCFLCGQPGHKGDKCQNPVCSKCLLPGHWHYQCHWSPHQAPPCALCHTKGHLCQQCPSIWRRYHLTTAAGPVVSVSECSNRQEHKTPFCYNCGHEGHYGYECARSKKSSYIIPVSRVVSDYGDPRKVLRNPVHAKLWRRKLKLACIPYPKEGPKKNSKKAKERMERQMLLSSRRSKPKKKKGRVKTGNGTGDIVRIDPISESSFPRTKKKAKKQNIPGLSASFLRNVRRKSLKDNFNRNTRNFL